MSTSLFTISLLVSLSAGPYGYGGCSTCGTAGGGYYGGGYGGDVGYVSDYGGIYDGGYASGGSADPLFPFDGPEPWLHGYYQEIPAYGGYHRFLPYNYKHVLSQSQAAAGWGLSPNMPYSQQWWHRYESRSMMKQRVSQALPVQNGTAFVNTNTQVQYTNENQQFPNQTYTTTTGVQQISSVPDQPISQAELQQQLRQQAIELQALQNSLQQQQQLQQQRSNAPVLRLNR